nr:MAG TPA: hypothetical protein [Inoviridae sp.]
MNYVVLAEAGAVSGALDTTTMTVIQNGMNQLVSTVQQIVPIAVVASVSVIAITAGVNFALKKVKGVMSKAS